jgi:hypothetical protein
LHVEAKGGADAARYYSSEGTKREASVPDPITVGLLVAGALSLGGEAVKAAVGEAVKDAYKALKDKLAIWAAGDVAELEKTPHSDLRKAVIAEVVNGRPAEDQDELRGLAQVLSQLRVRCDGCGDRRQANIVNVAA